MLKVVPSKRLRGENDDGELSAYMQDGHYVITSGKKDVDSPMSNIVERMTPVPEENIAEAAGIVEHLGGNTPYHPIPIADFEGVEVSRPSIDRYNIAYKALAATGELDGATMCDLGCHYGYLSFSFECCGMVMTAYDLRSDVIWVGEQVQEILQSKVEFRIANIKDIVKSGQEYDYVLGMNVFHYVTAGMSRGELETLMVDLGKITRKAAIVTTLAQGGLDYEAIGQLGGFASVECVGIPEDSYPIWMLSKGTHFG